MRQLLTSLMLLAALLTACTGMPTPQPGATAGATSVSTRPVEPTQLPAPTHTPALTSADPSTDTPSPTEAQATPQALGSPTAELTTQTPVETTLPTQELSPTPAEEPTQPPEATPAPTPLPSPPPAGSAQASFAYGIQVDPSGDPDEIIGHLKTLGIEWVKFQVSWKEMEPQENIRNWGEWDRLILAYHNAGYKILLSIVKAPDWARPANTDLSQDGPPADPQTYARFVGELAKRYKGGVQAIEVWNEQNLAREGGGAPMPPADYVALLSAAYQAIKTADPSIVVVSGGPTPAGDVPGAAIDDITYLNAMYAAGLKGASDAIGAHPSGYNCPAAADWRTVTDPSAVFRGPFDNRHHSWCFRGTMEGYRDVMVANGDGDKRLWPTEFGWAVSAAPHTGYEYAADTTREEQAGWIVEAFGQAKAWGWVGPTFLWNLNYDITRPGSEQAAFGILTSQGPTPAYRALANVPK